MPLTDQIIEITSHVCTFSDLQSNKSTMYKPVYFVHQETIADLFFIYKVSLYIFREKSYFNIT